MYINLKGKKCNKTKIIRKGRNSPLRESFFFESPSPLFVPETKVKSDHREGGGLLNEKEWKKSNLYSKQKNSWKKNQIYVWAHLCLNQNKSIGPHSHDNPGRWDCSRYSPTRPGASWRCRRRGKPPPGGSTHHRGPNVTRGQYFMA